MANDERSRGSPSDGGKRPGSQSLDRPLPEHASAYYSPRPAPAETIHRTLENEVVRIDPSADPLLSDAETSAVRPASPSGLRPGHSDPPLSTAPTVLLPVVRARRRRHRIGAVLLVTLIGLGGGALYGLTAETAILDREGGPVVVRSPSPAAVRAPNEVTSIVVEYTGAASPSVSPSEPPRAALLEPPPPAALSSVAVSGGVRQERRSPAPPAGSPAKTEGSTRTRPPSRPAEPWFQ